MKSLVLLAALSCPATAAEQVVHYDAQGNLVSVLVIKDRCPIGINGACYAQHVIWADRDESLRHELAHVSGMKHTPWTFNHWGIPCARVTAAGLATGYEVGQVICNGPRGEYVDGK